MYLLYETYTDETKNMRDILLNTHIVGLYDDKKYAKQKLLEHLQNTKLNYKDKHNWYIKKVKKHIFHKNIIEIYEVYNDFIENYEEIFYVVLEKVRVKK